MTNFRLKTILLILIFLSSLAIASAEEKKLGFSLSAGSTIDVAPFGIEQQFYTLQAAYFIPVPISLGIKSLVALNKSARIFRVPMMLKIDMFTTEEKRITIIGYGGGGVEFYRSDEYKTNSPLLTAGLALTVGYVYTDISASCALRSFNTDSDISATAGIRF